MMEIKSKDFHSWHIPVSLIVKWWWERLRAPTFHGFSLFLGPKGDILHQVYKVPQKWAQGD